MWDERNYHGKIAWYYQTDRVMNEGGGKWWYGVSILIEDEDQFAIFEDDGYGTGAHVTDLSGCSIEEVKLYCENVLIDEVA